ncbi:hypothetical protein ABZ820_22395 [Streptomyces diacarni]|uniref:hypothetical protein n=1 Tax=Streptomyces diacarni TaxID=2800381 RepID=UPI0033DE8C7D
MFRARLKGSGRDVFAVQIDDEPAWYTGKHPLLCGECDASVHGKGTYVKGNGASYRAHFALNPKAKHAPACSFNPVEFLTTLAQAAQGLAHVQDGVLRLTLPNNLADLGPELESAGLQPPPEEATSRRINTVPPALPPLLNCAAKIARFLQLNAFDDTAVKRFKVQPHGYKAPIPWGRFCYGPTPESYGQLATRLDPTSSARTPSHPVAVYGTVQRVRKDRAERPFVYIADHADLDGREFEVVLRSMHPTLIQPLTAGTHVLAVGTWGLFTDGRVPQLRLFAEEAWQIAYWHTDATTGLPTQPTSPPALTVHQRTTERPARRPSTKKTSRRPTPPSTRHLTPTTTPRRPAQPSTPDPPADSPDQASDTGRHTPPPPQPEPPADLPQAAPSAPDTSAGTTPSEPESAAPAFPPRPASPPPAPRRRKRLPAWLARPRRRRR